MESSAGDALNGLKGLACVVGPVAAREPCVHGNSHIRTSEQGRGHRRETEAPTPFDGAVDFVSRFAVEQWVTFPRFVLSGAWAKNLRRARQVA